MNPSGDDDRLLSAESRAADRTEMHESIHDGEVVRMLAPARGFAVPAHGSVALERGGKHLMLLGLSHRDPAKPIPLTLRFERSGAIAVDVPVAEGT